MLSEWLGSFHVHYRDYNFDGPEKDILDPLNLQNKTIFAVLFLYPRISTLNITVRVSCIN